MVKYAYRFVRGDGAAGDRDGWTVEVRLYSGTGQYARRGDVIANLWTAGTKQEARAEAEKAVRAYESKRCAGPNCTETRNLKTDGEKLYCEVCR